METLTQKQFDRKYGQGHAVFFESDMQKFDQEIEKAIQYNTGFEKDIREQANLQKLALKEVNVVCKNKIVKAWVSKAPREPDHEAFAKHKHIINKALENSMIDIEKAEDLIMKAAKRYAVGDISDATGLQKQSDGSWAPPKGGKKGKKEDDKGSKDKKKEDDDEGLSDKKYFGPESENDVEQFKSDLKDGTISREKAIMELKGIGMEDEKVEKIVNSLAPKEDSQSSEDDEKDDGSGDKEQKFNGDAVRQWVGDDYDDKMIGSVIDSIEESGFDFDELVKIDTQPRNQHHQSELVHDKVDELFSEMMPNNWHADLNKRGVEDILWGLVMQSLNE